MITMKTFYALKKNDGIIYAERHRKEIWVGKGLILQPEIRLKLQEEKFVINEKTAE